MSLQVYHQKRKFDVTPEPRGKVARGKGNQYVIQKHAAHQLHYDLRLELDGVLKSWAVTKGPSLVPSEKRLAVQTEDHPVEYASFEGTIPEGEYGAGTVLIWDRGRWFPEGDAHEGLKTGNLTFRLEGEKLKGLWHLILMRGRPNDWLLIKGHDQWERSPKDPEILEQLPRSVVSGRTIEEIAEGKPAKRGRQPNKSVKNKVWTGGGFE